jgi:hypothetical protein
VLFHLFALRSSQALLAFWASRSWWPLFSLRSVDSVHASKSFVSIAPIKAVYSVGAGFTIFSRPTVLAIDTFEDEKVSESTEKFKKNLTRFSGNPISAV